MHTTGLAAETICRLYEGDRLATALRDARTRTLALYSHLDLATIQVPRIPIVNPPLWELSHIAWFQEHWCLRYSRSRGSVARASILPGADALFDSTTVPHETRWTLDYPPVRALRGYMESTLEATLDALAATPSRDRYFFALALLHEDMHGEALLMTLQALGLPPPPTPTLDPPVSRPRPAKDIEFAGGDFEQGSRQEGEHFVFDNEKWAHRKTVGSFRMAERPASQGEYLAFIEADGYRREALWTPQGWRWAAENGASAPLNWRRDSQAWLARRFDRWLPVDPHAPMVHISLHEALAFCRWAGRRLPTEVEWEFAARNGGANDRFPWGDDAREHGAGLDYRHRGPSSSLEDSAPSRSGLQQMIGGVWEWTSSALAPYPGFHADPYKEYSEPWFDSHYVLRGGSFATRSRLAHNRFRNFYLPERADVFAGLRTCAVETG